MWILSKLSRKATLSNAYPNALQTLSQQLLQAQDEERRKVARDLHDSTGQTLTALKISATLLQEKVKQDASLLKAVSELAALADQALQEVRTMSYLLHPPLLDEAGFACAARWLVEGFAERSGIRVLLDIQTARDRMPIEIETALFRVLQESLTNVHRHSGALEVSICFEHRGATAVLEVRDSGRGIPAERLKRLRETSLEMGVGLAGMHERLTQLSGRLEIESDDHGTSMRATVPIPFLALRGPGDQVRAATPAQRL